MRLRPAFDAVFRFAAGLVAPDRCAACDCDAGGRPFCVPCWITVVEATPLDRGKGSAPFEYGGAIAEAIRHFKFHDRPDLGRVLGDSLGRFAASQHVRADVVVPVPLFRSRLRERGYNQSTLLSARVARHLAARHAPRLLVRTRDTPHQVGRSRAPRVENVAGAFRVSDEREAMGRRVVLVDDVRTTGATLEACAAALMGAGASVSWLTLAVVPDRAGDSSSRILGP